MQELSGQPIRLLLGAGGQSLEGWIASDLQSLDITNPAHWQRCLAPSSVDRMLAEHVLEHLTESQNLIAMRLCREFLKPGGVLRIAVPDGNRRDACYAEEVAPPRDGHQVLFTVESLTTLLDTAGLHAVPLEYFDAGDRFHATEWASADGHIQRSVRYDRQIAFKRQDLFYTSLIVDAVRAAK